MRAASMIAVSPLRQTLLMVVAGTVHGMPGSHGCLACGVLAGAGLDDLAHEDLVDDDGSDARAVESAPRIATAPSDAADSDDSPPFRRAIGVRANDRITTSRSARS